MAKMYTCDEVAERYKVKVITVWDWIRQHKLNAIKLGREYRISEEDLIQFENERKTIPTNQVLKMNLQRKHSRMTVKMLFIICLMLATDIQ